MTDKTESKKAERDAAIVAAIRADALVGRWTCSSIDECSSDADLVRDYGDELSVSAAVRAARKDEERYLDRMMDCRFGDDSDSEVSIMKEWKGRKKAAGKVAKPPKEYRIAKAKTPPAGPTWTAAIYDDGSQS